MAFFEEYILADYAAPGLSLVVFLPITMVISIANAVGVFQYRKYIAKNPDKAVAVKLNPGLLIMLR